MFLKVFLMNLVAFDNHIVGKGNSIQLAAVQLLADIINAVFLLHTYLFTASFFTIYMQLLFFYPEINKH